MSDRRRRREQPVATVPEPAPPAVDGVEGADLAAALDEEIARLPGYQRAPVVMCELEGRSRQDAAARLGISDGTLSSRLARARRALAGRLRRRGVGLTAAGLAAAFARLAPAGVPGGLVPTAVACAIGPGPVPAAVAALSHGVLRVMLSQKLKVSPSGRRRGNGADVSRELPRAWAAGRASPGWARPSDDWSWGWPQCRPGSIT